MPSSAVVWRAACAANADFSGRGEYTRAGGAGTGGTGGTGGSGSAAPSASRSAVISCRVRLTAIAHHARDEGSTDHVGVRPDLLPAGGSLVAAGNRPAGRPYCTR